jgi:uncharacterized protein YecE (DUF72 family)
MTVVYVGTSGWSYDWNIGNSLEWYIQESTLNAMELNMSYYRFPYPNMVKSWAKKGSDLAWIVKVHRSITHYRKLQKGCYDIFQRFKKLFFPLKNSIHYYLLQLPPSFNDLDVVEHFIASFGSEQLAIEFRSQHFFSENIKRWAKNLGVLLVSIDAPKLPQTIMSDKIIYERIHGRTGWYSHDYQLEELKEIKERMLKSHPKKVYVFFNNNHAMLQNAERMYSLLQK